MKLSKIKPNPNNPRIIKDDKFEKLKKSIKDFPKMMELRPMVINSDNIVLGGNMRLKALKELGYKEVPEEWIKRAKDLTEEEQRQFIIKDNVGFGEHDWEMLATEWNADELSDWGLDVPLHEQEINNAEEGEEIEIPQSVQIEPPQEYILIMAEPNSVDWEDLKEILKLKMVRRGGYKKGSDFDSVGLERVLTWGDLKNRLNVNSSTK
jgi:hypothetical protein